MTLTGMIQQSPAPGAFSHQGLEVETIQADGADYETARSALVGQVPDGWRLLSIRTW